MENNQARLAAKQAKNRILIFSTAYLPLVGGAEIAVKEITNRLPNPSCGEASWHFDMITAKIQFGLPKFEKIGNINVYRIGFGCKLDKFLLPVLGFWKAYWLNRKNNYDLAWSIMASQAGVAASFFKIFNPSKKLLLTLQEGDLETHLERYVLGNKFLYKFLIKPWHLLPFRKVDRIQAISHFLADRARNNGYKKDIDIIPNGVNLEKFKRSSEQEIQELRNRLNIKEGERVILTVSRLVYKNGVDDLIKAGKHIGSFPFKILIAGIGQDEKKLKNLTKQLNLENKVLFLGHIDYDELPKYYSIADVFVRASRSEGFGNVFLEALACGILPVGTAVDGSAVRILYERKAGLGLAENPNGMPVEIANRVKIAVSDDIDVKKGNQRSVQNGKELIREEYTWDKIAEKMEKIFMEI